MRNVLTLTILITTFSFSSIAQGLLRPVVKSKSTTASKSPVLYDPLFWSNQLKLSENQQRKISEINYEFYERVKSVAARNPDHNSPFYNEIAGYLITRSEEIWNTFNVRQKRKWEKLAVL